MLRIASDLHLEFLKTMDLEAITAHFLPDLDSGDILVLAGDICNGVTKLALFLDYVAERCKHVVMVPGNHDIYGYTIENWRVSVHKLISATNITIGTPRGAVEATIDGQHFVLSTMWGDAGRDNPLREADVLFGLGRSDFTHIRYSGEKFNTAAMRQVNATCLAELNELVQEDSIVVTHHLPSHSLCHPRFSSAQFNMDGGFACDAEEILLRKRPLLWIFGHTHDTIDTTLYFTRVVANPAGYASEKNTEFNTFFGNPKRVEYGC